MKYEEFCHRVDATDWDEVLCVGIKGLAQTLALGDAEINDDTDNSIAIRIEDAHAWLQLHRGIVSGYPASYVLLEKHLYVNARAFPWKVVIAQTGQIIFDPEVERSEFEKCLPEDWSTDD